MHEGRWWWKHEMKKQTEIRQPAVQSHIFSWHLTKVRRCLLSANLDMHRWKTLTSFACTNFQSWSGINLKLIKLMFPSSKMDDDATVEINGSTSEEKVHLWRLTWKQNYMWPYASAQSTYYVTGFGREGAGHEFSEFLFPHWTLPDMLCLVSMTPYKIQKKILWTTRISFSMIKHPLLWFFSFSY